MCNKKKIIFEKYTDCLFNDKIILKFQQRFKSDYHNINTEQINKVAIINNDDKRLQKFDKITTYPISVWDKYIQRTRKWDSK